MGRQPTSRTENEKAFGRRIAAMFGQRFEGSVEGPNRVGAFVISRVWTEEDLDDGDIEYHAHYAVQRGHDLEVFENFAPFANWLTNEFDLDRASERRQKELDKAAERRANFIRVVVAAAVTIGAFVIFSLATYRNPSATILGYIATVVVGGGAGLLFGNWSRPKKDQFRP